MLEKGDVPDERHMLELLKKGYAAIARTTEEPEGVREEIQLTVKAFFQGYLGMTEEEMEFLQPKEDGSYDYSTPDDEELKPTVLRIITRLEEEK